MMKKITLFLAGLFCSLSLLANEPLPIGTVLPKGDVKMKDIGGKEVNIKDAVKKNGVLVIFSCNTCPYVIKNEQRLKEIAKFALDNEIGVIFINSNEAQRDKDDSYDAMKAYAKKQGYNWYYVVDKNHEVADAFDAKRTPECFLFNNDLKLTYHGAIDDNPSDASNVQRNHLKIAIEEMVAGKSVSITESKSVGCTIKRLKKD